MFDDDHTSLTAWGKVILAAGAFIWFFLAALLIWRLDFFTRHFLNPYVDFFSPAAAILGLVFWFCRKLGWWKIAAWEAAALVCLYAAVSVVNISLWESALIVDAGQNVHVKYYSMSAILAPTDDAIVVQYQIMKGLLETRGFGNETLASCKLRAKREVLAAIAPNIEPHSMWRVERVQTLTGPTDSVPIDGEAEIGCQFEFSVRATTTAITLERKSFLENYVRLYLPREVVQDVESGDLPPDHFSVSILFPTDTLIGHDPGTVVDALFKPGGNGGERLTITQLWDPDGIGLTYLRPGYRSSIVYAIFSLTLLVVLLFILGILIAILGFFLAIARDLIAAERIKPAIVRFLRRIGVLKPAQVHPNASGHAQSSPLTP
ncbi:MAG TPA: hypothetical protein VII56_23080 [Rhizomicrobium sp.]